MVNGKGDLVEEVIPNLYCHHRAFVSKLGRLAFPSPTYLGYLCTQRSEFTVIGITLLWVKHGVCYCSLRGWCFLLLLPISFQLRSCTSNFLSLLSPAIFFAVLFPSYFSALQIDPLYLFTNIYFPLSVLQAASFLAIASESLALSDLTLASCGLNTAQKCLLRIKSQNPFT